MALQFRHAVSGDLDALVDRDLQAFPGSFTAVERATWRDALDLDQS